MPNFIFYVKRSFLPAMVFCSYLFVFSNASALTWEKTVLDSVDNDVGQFCDLEIDSLGNMHAVYLDSDNLSLKLISNVGGFWQVPETLDASGSVSGYCGIAVSPVGTRRVSYRRSDTEALWYAGPESSPTWALETIESSGDAGLYCSLGIDTVGYLYTAYLQNDDGELRVKSNIGAGWQASEPVDTSGSVAGYCGIAVSPVGTRRVSYRRDDTEGLWYAGPETTLRWSSKTVCATPSDAGRYVSLALAPDGRLGGAFYAFDEISLGSIRIIALEGDAVGAARSVVDSIATSPSDGAHVDLAINAHGEWQVAFRNVGEPALYFALADTVVTGVGDSGGGGDTGTTDGAPLVFRLNQNFPNPFNPQTTIAYSITETGFVNISVFDVTGRLVRTLVNESKTAGRHQTRWNARDDRGLEVASGIYFVRLVSAAQVETKKVVVVK